MRARPKKRPDYDTDKGLAEYQGCLRKAAFESERIALKTAAVPSDYVAPGVVLRAYRCRFCKKFHLTKLLANDYGPKRDARPDASAFDVIDENENDK